MYMRHEMYIYIYSGPCDLRPINLTVTSILRQLSVTPSYITLAKWVVLKCRDHCACTLISMVAKVISGFGYVYSGLKIFLKTGPPS